MLAKQPPSEQQLTPYEATISQERQLWRAIYDPQLPPTVRVTAYARWLETGDHLKECDGSAPRRIPTDRAA